jgi:hypothetical protein
MDSTGKIVNLWLFILFTLVFIPPLRADNPDDDKFFPDDEPPAYDTLFSSEEELPDGASFVFEAPPLILEVPSFQLRSFDDVFPGLSRVQRANILTGKGARYSFEKGGSPTLIPDTNSGINLFSGVLAKNPSHIIEALVLVPYNRRILDLLDVYNALRKIKNIQNHTLSIQGKDVKYFKETTRLESAQRRRPVPDPPRTEKLPYSETVYFRIVDQYMGDLYIRGNISTGLYGITYSLSNFRDVYYFIFRIMKAETFTATVYLEPVKEGILIYSMSGFYIPNFVARRVNLTPNMNNRISVLIKWITEGLGEEENYSQRNYYYQQ